MRPLLRLTTSPIVAAFCLLQQAPAPNPKAPAPDPWKNLELLEATSGEGAKISKEGDGALFVDGTNAEHDSYRLVFARPGFAITAFQLESLPDPRLPMNGAGRGPNGNFVLSEFLVATRTRAAKHGKELKLGHATADFSQPGTAATSAFDGRDNTGWGVQPAVAERHELVVETQTDLRVGEGEILEITLEFKRGRHMNLGRFRLRATAQPRPVRAAGSSAAEASTLPERVNRAIDRGCEWLLSTQELDGSWDNDATHYRNGATALAVHALLKSGVRKESPAIVRALEWLRCEDPKETYSLGCECLALSALNDPTQDAWIRRLGQALLANQRPSGTFDYGFKPGGDLSNTQYAALGLRAAAQHGFKVPADVWDRMAEGTVDPKQAKASVTDSPLGFAYKPGDAVTGSMTAAGVAILAICNEQLKGHSKVGSLTGLTRRGVDWIARNFAVDCNPFAGNAFHYYWLYGLERVGALLATDKMGDHDWYREGAEFLVDHQRESGEWGGQTPTCWALLFLTRATAAVSSVTTRSPRTFGGDDPAQPLSIRASGDTPLTFWISSWGDETRAKLEWPGEKGRGPRVAFVEWSAQPTFGEDRKEFPIGRVERDAKQPCGDERFGAQWTFARPGRYRIRAVAHLLAPPATSGAEPAAQELASEPLELEIREVLDPELLEYARDPSRDLIRGATATASSRRDGWEPEHAVDGLLSHGWAGSDDDPLPTLTIELAAPVRASRLLVTPANLGADHPGRIRKLQVTFDGAAPLELTLVADDRRKSHVDFPPAVIRKITLKVTEVSNADATRKGVGLAEVELQLVEREKK